MLTEKLKSTPSQRSAVAFLLILAIMGIITLAISVGVVHLPEEGLLFSLQGFLPSHR